MQSRYIVLLIFFCLQTVSIFGQPQLPLSKAVEIALENAYNLKIAQSNISITEKNNNWGEAGKMPTISSSINNNNTYSSIQNPTSFLNGADVVSSNNSIALDLQWVLFDGGRVKTNKNKLAVLVDQSNADAQIIIDNIALQVSKAYYNVLVQQKRLEMFSELLKYSRDKISYIEARKEFGQALEFDLLQVKDAYLNDSIQYLLQQTNYNNAIQNLSLMMGLDASIPFNYKLVYGLNYLLPEYSYDKLLEALRNNNRQLRAEKVKIRLSELDIELQKANQYPRIVVGANISEQYVISRIEGKQPQIPNDWRGGSTTNTGLNIGLNYTIYNGGKIKRAIEVSKIRKEISEFNLNDIERRLSQQLKISYNQFQNQSNVLTLSQEMLKNSTKNLSIAEERFKANTLNFFDFRSIQINYIRSINSVQDAFLNAKNTEFDMLLQSGNLMKTD